MRYLTLFAEDTAAMEDLRTALISLQIPPWHPNPEGVPFGSPQVRYTQKEAAELAIALLRRCIDQVTIGAEGIVP